MLCLGFKMSPKSLTCVEGDWVGECYVRQRDVYEFTAKSAVRRWSEEAGHWVLTQQMRFSLGSSLCCLLPGCPGLNSFSSVLAFHAIIFILEHANYRLKLRAKINFSCKLWDQIFCPSDDKIIKT